MNRAIRRQTDAVDAILDQWARERPDLDTSPMGPIGRIKRCAALLQQRVESNLAQFDLSLWEFDMLATLPFESDRVIFRSDGDLGHDDASA